MYRTREIRWFFEEKKENIENWFNDQHLSFGTSSERIDHYLVTDNSDMNIKLREGRLEIKQRNCGPRSRTMVDTATGYCEVWTKWSFAVEDNSTLVGDIVKDRYQEWIKVAKNRLAVNLIEKDGAIQVRPISEQVDSGCQVELTKILIEGSIWYTFGLEWFGGDDESMVQPIIHDILNGSELNIKQSMGYAGFLKNQIFTHAVY